MCIVQFIFAKIFFINRNRSKSFVEENHCIMHAFQNVCEQKNSF